MKKLALLIVILYVFTPNPTHAASELEIWCLADGETWDAVTSTCFVNGGAVLSPNSGALTVLASETIDINKGIIFNYDTLNNYGTINIGNKGTIENFSGGDSIINNYGIINNDKGTTGGTIRNGTGSIINNYGIINNDDHDYTGIEAYGTIINYGDGTIINNYGTIINSGDIINNGATINIYGTIINNIDGTIINENYDYNIGTINSYCEAIYVGELPEGNDIVYYLCVYLPIIKR